MCLMGQRVMAEVGLMAQRVMESHRIQDSWVLHSKEIGLLT